MNYEGKLYGKVGSKYFELGVDTTYTDKLHDEIALLKAENAKLQESNNQMAELIKEMKKDADTFAIKNLNTYYTIKIYDVFNRRMA